MDLQSKTNDALWIARSLYELGLVKGSAGNMSFIHDGVIYITASGSSFGRLAPDDLATVMPDGGGSGKPSKELPLHRMLYERCGDTGAVIHVHSTFATLWSCLPHPAGDAAIPRYTPYLEMKLGRIGLIPYAPPGSAELFEAFRRSITAADGYLMCNHGAIVGGKTLMEAYNGAMELEESCRIAWMLRNESGARLLP